MTDALHGCYVSARAATMRGTVQVPGDKSISHRALMLASQAIGTSTIAGLLLGEDVMRTAKALQTMGVAIHADAAGLWHVDGVGIGGLAEPDDVLDMGNAGTGSRLLMGLVSSYPFLSFFTGDASLRKRPMARIAKPLEMMGARFLARSECRLPLAVQGSDTLIPINYSLPVASAQVKSAILLAALNTAGSTTVIEPEATRDHTERMLTAMGIRVAVEEIGKGAKSITLTGHTTQPKSFYLSVPGDPSSAAFLVVAALLVPGAKVTIENICINPLRTGLFTCLKEMGATLHFTNERDVGGEMVADIVAEHSSLRGITVPAERAPSMIDEYPILCIAAAVADGTTYMPGLEELKVKESNRLQAMADGLIACGVSLEVGEASLTIYGEGKTPQGGATITTHMDHRIAMAFLVMGAIAEQAVVIDEVEMINTSFPGFITLFNQLGGAIEPYQRQEQNAAAGHR